MARQGRFAHQKTSSELDLQNLVPQFLRKFEKRHPVRTAGKGRIINQEIDTAKFLDRGRDRSSVHPRCSPRRPQQANIDARARAFCSAVLSISRQPTAFSSAGYFAGSRPVPVTTMSAPSSASASAVGTTNAAQPPGAGNNRDFAVEMHP